MYKHLMIMSKSCVYENYQNSKIAAIAGHFNVMTY
jgi:hypothetical protein